MNAPCVLYLFYFAALCAASSIDSSVPNRETSLKNSSHVQKIELYDGVYIEIPEEKEDTRKIISLQIDASKDEVTGRGKQKKMMQKILPLFIMPFVLQSTIVPLFLGMLKFMLFKSLMIGKLALVLIIINAFRNSNSFKGRQDENLANIHYGYHGNGMEEYGAYFNS